MVVHQVDLNRTITYPHPQNIHRKYPFTQALEVFDENLDCIDKSKLTILETSGGYTDSTIRLIQVDLPKDALEHQEFKIKSWSDMHKDDFSVNVLAEFEYPQMVFAEGAVIIGNKVYLITWRDYKLFEANIYCNNGSVDIEWSDPFYYDLQGWGFSASSDTVFATDGTDVLYSWPIEYLPKLSQATAQKTSIIACDYHLNVGTPTLSRLNELHFHKKRNTLIGMIFSSKNHIAVEIEVTTGKCINKYNFDALGAPQPKPDGNSVFNGVVIIEEGYIPAHDVWLVTGKKWNSMFLTKVKTIHDNELL